MRASKSKILTLTSSSRSVQPVLSLPVFPRYNTLNTQQEPPLTSLPSTEIVLDVRETGLKEIITDVPTGIKGQLELPSLENDSSLTLCTQPSFLEVARRTSNTNSGLRFEMAAYKPVSFDSCLPSKAMVVMESSITESTPLDDPSPLSKAIVSTNNSTSLETPSNFFTAEQRYSLVKSIRDNQHFTSTDKVKFIKVLLNTEFFKHKHNYIQVCKLYGGDPFTTLQALGGSALNLVEDTTLPGNHSSKKLNLDIVECNSFLTDGNLRKLTGLQYESNITQLIKIQMELSVKPLKTYHSLEEALTNNQSC